MFEARKHTTDTLSGQVARWGEEEGAEGVENGEEGADEKQVTCVFRMRACALTTEESVFV